MSRFIAKKDPFVDDSKESRATRRKLNRVQTELLKSLKVLVDNFVKDCDTIKSIYSEDTYKQLRNEEIEEIVIYYNNRWKVVINKLYPMNKISTKDRVSLSRMFNDAALKHTK